MTSYMFKFLYNENLSIGDLLLSWGESRSTFIHKQPGDEVKGIWGDCR